MIRSEKNYNPYMTNTINNKIISEIMDNFYIMQYEKPEKIYILNLGKDFENLTHIIIDANTFYNHLNEQSLGEDGDLFLLCDKNNINLYRTKIAINKTYTGRNSQIELILIAQIEKKIVNRHLFEDIIIKTNSLNSHMYDTLENPLEVYRYIHNMFLLDNVFYFDIKINQSTYTTQNIINLLNSVTSILDYVVDEEIYIKINANSPGDILLYFENGITFFHEHWLAILLIFLFLGGGKVEDGKYSFTIPSVSNLIKFFANHAYDKEVKKQTLTGMQLDNKAKELEIKKMELEISKKLNEIQENATELNVCLNDDSNIINFQDYLINQEEE